MDGQKELRKMRRYDVEAKMKFNQKGHGNRNTPLVSR